MKKYTFLFLSLVACSSIKIKDVIKAENFSIVSYKTFSFYDVEAGGDALGANYKYNLKLLKEAITKEMELKNVRLNTDQPDLLINIGVVVLEKVQTRETSFSNPGDRTYYMGQRNYSWQSQEVEVGRYREGTVTLDFVDRVTNKLVWQGSAESIVPDKERNVPPLIEEGVKKLLSKCTP